MKIKLYLWITLAFISCNKTKLEDVPNVKANSYTKEIELKEIKSIIPYYKRAKQYQERFKNARDWMRLLAQGYNSQSTIDRIEIVANEAKIGMSLLKNEISLLRFTTQNSTQLQDSLAVMCIIGSDASMCLGFTIQSINEYNEKKTSSQRGLWSITEDAQRVGKNIQQYSQKWFSYQR